jgi:hypothetical protein
MPPENTPLFGTEQACSGRPLDHDEQGVVHRLSSDLAQALAAGHEWVAVADDRSVGMRRASSRSRDGYRVRARKSRKVLGTPNRR